MCLLTQTEPWDVFQLRYWHFIVWSWLERVAFSNDTSLAFAGHTFGKNVQNELANNVKNDIGPLIKLLTEMDGNFGFFLKLVDFLLYGLISFFPNFYHLLDNKITFFSSPSIISNQKSHPLMRMAFCSCCFQALCLEMKLYMMESTECHPHLYIFDKQQRRPTKNLDPFRKYLKNLHRDVPQDTNFENNIEYWKQ